MRGGGPRYKKIKPFERRKEKGGAKVVRHARWRAELNVRREGSEESEGEAERRKSEARAGGIYRPQEGGDQGIGRARARGEAESLF